MAAWLFAPGSLPDSKNGALYGTGPYAVEAGAGLMAPQVPDRNAGTGVEVDDAAG